MVVESKQGRDDQVAHFTTFAQAVVALAAVLTLGTAIPALVVHSARMGAGAGLLALYGVFAVWTLRWARQGELIAAASRLSYGLLGLVIGAALLTPFGYSSLTLTAIVAPALAMPYLEGRRLKHLFVASVVTIVIVQADGYLAPLASRSGYPRWVTWVTELSGTAAASGLMFTLFSELVTNLVENAVKYGRGAPIDVELRVAGGLAVLRVTDHGIGIAPADQTRIFERFERATVDRRYSGLGLGLWIARQIAEASGGSIELYSELGRGATFTVRLPIRASAEAHPLH